ncbi:MAG: hypothetical protein MZV70_14005 [Desulfobacterales bacterium]|nr:hypothetical protein [Desulfobacterales bacterium]
MSGKFISVRMGMGGMFGRECGFFHGLMGCMRKRMFSRMMPGIFQMTRSVLAGPCFERWSGPGFLSSGLHASVTYTVISLLDIKGMVVVRGFKGFLGKAGPHKKHTRVLVFWFGGVSSLF